MEVLPALAAHRERYFYGMFVDLLSTSNTQPCTDPACVSFTAQIVGIFGCLGGGCETSECVTPDFQGDVGERSETGILKGSLRFSIRLLRIRIKR